jgi:Ni,Fe-hydrogenase maturation factor
MASKQGMTGLTTRVVHQLTPELAVDIAGSERVIFADASLHREMKVDRIQADPGASAESHLFTPGALLALADTLYDSRPEAWIIAIPGHSFELRQGLSVVGTCALQQAAVSLSSLLQAE